MSQHMGLSARPLRHVPPPWLVFVLQDGSEILIASEDIKARAAETQAAQQAQAAVHARRMDQQLKARLPIEYQACVFCCSYSQWRPQGLTYVFC